MKTKTVVIIILSLSLSVCFSCKKSSIEATKWLVAGPDKELVEGLRQKAKRDSINRTPEEREAIRQQQERNAEIEEIRNAEIERLRAEGGETTKYYDDELETKNNGEIPYNLGLLILVLLIGSFFFMIWWFVIRKIRNNIRDLSYTSNTVTTKFDSAMNDPRLENMSDEEREAMAKMKKFLHRK